MKVAWKLAVSYALRHPSRMLLTSAAVVASACVVVWVVSGYDAIASQFGNRTSEYLGRFEWFVVPDSLEDAYLPQGLIEAMRRDPAIAAFEPALQATVRVQSDNPMPARTGPGGGRPGSKGAGFGGPGSVGPGFRGPGGGRSGAEGPAAPKTADRAASQGPGGAQGGPPRGMFFGGPKLVGTEAVLPPYELLEGRWIDHRDPALREAVISNQSAEMLPVKLGDDVLVISGTKEYRLKIVGVVRQVSASATIRRQSPTGRPMMSGPGNSLGPAPSALYVPLALAEKIARQPGKINLLSIKLREDADVAAFRARWLAQLAQAQPAALLVGAGDLRGAMEDEMMASGARRQAWAATGMALLAALFIIFTTLSMGVNERVRQFGVMRAVGLSRFQVGCVIAVEGVLLGLIGWAGGLAAGWGLLTVVGNARPGVFSAGAQLGAWSVALAGATALGGALIASVVPALYAMRLQPLEAMAPRYAPRPSLKLSLALGLLGLLLIGLNPLLVYVLPIEDAVRYGIYAAIGCTSMALGFVLLAPLAIVTLEAVGGPAIARAFAVEPRLMRSQLGSNLWRTTGATIALTVGLGLYVSMLVWGYSMLGPFKPGDWVPDVLAAFQSGGLPDAELYAVRGIPGVIAEQCIPLAVDQPRLTSDITDSKRGNSVTRQDNVIIIGLDPQVAFGGPRPLVPATFVAGNPTQAIAKLKSGRCCIVPDHFLTATGLKIGDRFGMIPPENPARPVEYEIAAAVSLPGWHWMTKFSGLRRRSGRSAAMIFAGYDEVRQDFDLRKINFIWMNTDKRVDVDTIGAAMQPIADRNLGETQPVNAQGTWSVGARTFGSSLRISTPDDVRTRILARADDMIWAMCELPLITLLVTATGVVNAMMASVRARRWELGVLRAVGITRGTMFRMIVAEALLIGMVACALSLAFGVLAGWCGTGISQYVSFFGGMATPLVIPWGKIGLGFALTLALCTAAAWWPALRASRAEPLKLLQEGRDA